MKLSTLFACAFFIGFAAFSAKVKKDVLRKEAMKSFGRSISYGSKAPEFELPALDGQTYRLDEEVAANKLVLINFWATWCPPCRLEMPQLETLYQRHRADGLQILAVDVGEDEGTVGAFIAAKPVSFPVLLDRDQQVSTRYRVEAFPTSLLLDSEGNVLDVIEGLDAYLSYRVESHLESGSEDDP